MNTFSRRNVSKLGRSHCFQGRHERHPERFRCDPKKQCVGRKRYLYIKNDERAPSGVQNFEILMAADVERITVFHVICQNCYHCIAPFPFWQWRLFAIAYF